jgi:hypothetical protein
VKVRSLRYPRSAIGPTIFSIGAMCSFFIVSYPARIPGSPSTLNEFLKAQYLVVACDRIR